MSAHLPICILLPARASLSKRKSPSSAGHPHPLFPRCVCGWGRILRQRTCQYVNYCLRALPCLNENPPPRRSILTPFSPAVFAGGGMLCRRTCQYVNYCPRALPCLSGNPPPRRGILTPFSPLSWCGEYIVSAQRPFIWCVVSANFPICKLLPACASLSDCRKVCLCLRFVPTGLSLLLRRGRISADKSSVLLDIAFRGGG